MPPMPETFADFAARIDARTAADLVAAGSNKWTTHPGCLGAGIAEMDFGLAPAIEAALEEAWGRRLTGYAPQWLRDDLMTATAGFVADRYGWSVAPEQVSWLPDVLSGLAILLNHLTPGDGAVVVPTPAYMPFIDMPRVFGRPLVEVPMLRTDAGWELDLDRLEDAFRAGAAVFVLCNPHNPIGKVYTSDELAAVTALAERYDVRVFSDEIHAPLTYPGATHVPYASTSEAAAQLAVTAMSASKSWNVAGLKCAQLVLTADADRAAWSNLGHGSPYESSTLGMVANVAAYRDARDWLDHAVAYLDRNRGVLVDGLAGASGARVIPPEATYLALVDLRDYAIDEPLDAWARRAAGVALTDGRECGRAGAGFVRIGFAAPTPIVAEIADRLVEALKASD